MSRYILITIDVEEFDIPREYGNEISDEDSIQTSRHGADRFFSIVDNLNIPCTIFTTAHFAQKNPELIKSSSQRHEIASHGYYHTNHINENLASSKFEIERIIEKKVFGYRHPRLKDVDTKLLLLAGYTYNSSLNPTWIPGRYMNLNKPRLAYHDVNILNLPISVTPFVRFPLFWLSFKRIPLLIYKKLCYWTLQRDRYLHLIFHPWEFADIKDFNIPDYIKKPCGDELCERLYQLLMWLNNCGEFLTCYQYLSLRNFDIVKTSNRR